MHTCTCCSRHPTHTHRRTCSGVLVRSTATLTRLTSLTCGNLTCMYFWGYIIPLLFERYERGLEDMAGDESLVAPAKHANLQRRPMDTVLFSPFLIYAAVRAITLPCAIAVTSCTLIKGHWRLVLDCWRSYCKLGRSERHCWISFWEDLRHNLVDCRCKRAA